VEPALPGHWRCPLQGGWRSDTKCAKPGGVHNFLLVLRMMKKASVKVTMAMM
jgi:hypothetical protein